MLRRTSVRSRGTYGKLNKSAMVLAQRKALRLASRAVAGRHYGPPGPAPRGELKGMDTLVEWTSVLSTTNTNGNTEVLNLVQTGTGSWNRVGRKVCLKSIRVMGYVECNIKTIAATDELYGNVFRMCIVWDKQPSGAAIPAFDDIFGYTTQTGSEATNIYSPPKYDSLDRFRVIKDWAYDFNPECTPTNGNVQIRRMDIDEYIALPNLESNYSGQSNPMTIADINTGALYLIGRCITNDAASSQCGAYLNCRLRYVD